MAYLPVKFDDGIPVTTIDEVRRREREFLSKIVADDLRQRRPKISADEKAHYFRERRKQLEADGICTCCACRKAKPGRKRCDICLAREKARKQAERIS